MNLPPHNFLSGAILFDSYVIPPTGVSSITDYRTRYSGIRPSHMRQAIPFSQAVQRVKDIILGNELVEDEDEDAFHRRGVLVVGHDLRNDFGVLGFHVAKKMVRDTRR